ncbi:hypothetical protein CS0771_43110 [Catellatospora sp. IY07-71]|uniref:hypothetical protein n=1 Tax=Catellatospora sp. IY07-71 TaxID=2728827 RepID=UPI001BB33514|nr:hypothetical protein [Catellatospora sp. IY07-71]BCJ74767.1 hypothetical protein CS0771_43110 [Catellatospora sp. IY07-71]
MSNGEPLRRVSPAAPVLAGLAALATGVVFYYYGLASTAYLVGLWFYKGGNTSLALQTVVIVLGAALTVTVADRWPGVLRSSGWLVTTVGLLAVLAALQLKPEPKIQAGDPMAGLLGPVQAHRILSVMLEAGLGVAIAGVLLGTALPGAIRLATGLGLIAGIALGQPVLVLLAERGPGAEPLDLDLILPIAALVLALLAALACSRQRSAVPPAAPSPEGTPAEAVPSRRPGIWGAAVAVLAATVIVHAGRLLLRTVADEVQVTQDGLPTPRRAEFAEDLMRYGLVAITVAAALVLAGYAYRRGRADLAAWPVLCFLLATPLALALWAFTPVGRSPYTMALIALAGIVLGAAAVWFADRRLPWDVVGVAAAGCGVVLVLNSYRQDATWREAGTMLAFAGIGFALSTGLVRVLRATRGEPGGAAAALLLGFAALVLAWPSNVTLALGLTGHDGIDAAWTLVVALTGGTAAVLALLFGFTRAVDRVRRDIRAEAARAES